MSVLPLRHVLPLALLGTFSACAAPGAFAQTGGPFNYQIQNDTFSGGDPVFPVTDDLTFNDLHLTETFSDGFSSTALLGSLTTAGLDLQSPATLFDPSHGALSSSVLTGTLGRDTFPFSPALDVTTQLAPGGPTTDQVVSSSFSTTLYGTANQGDIGVGQFSLLAGNDPLFGRAPTIISVSPVRAAPVPEASTTVSLALMLALGAGLLVARRRSARAQ
jgi:hypothetical protein